MIEATTAAVVQLSAELLGLAFLVAAAPPMKLWRLYQLKRKSQSVYTCYLHARCGTHISSVSYVQSRAQRVCANSPRGYFLG